MNFTLKTGLAVAVLSVASAGQLQAQMRFQGMDRNHDGVITRNEWRGNDQSFRNQDWNGDGVLSGDEVRPGAQRSNANLQHNGVGDWNKDGVVNEQDDLIGRRFNAYDHNGNGRIAMDEWRAGSGDMRLFSRLDTNHDRTLTLEEFATNNTMFAQGGPVNGFTNIDRNRDGWITRNEWNMGNAEFNRLDTNRDNRISKYEFQVPDNSNSSGYYPGNSPYYAAPVRDRVTQAGYDRGLSEGRQAGREDYVNGHGWDLDGQTELERADSGYYSQLGPLSEYQNGYREGFRLAYREGFNQR